MVQPAVKGWRLIVRFFRTIATGIALAVPLAGCSSPQFQPARISSFGAMSLPATNPCKISGFFYFRGACTQQLLPAAGATIKLTKYKGLTLSMAFPKNRGRGKVTITMGDATGNGDITGKVDGRRFSAYPAPCAKPSCPGTAFMYFFFDSSVKVSKLKGYSTLTITNAGTYPGAACYIAFDQFSGTLGWYPIGSYSGMPDGKTLKMSILFSGLAPGPEANTFAVLCV